MGTFKDFLRKSNKVLPLIYKKLNKNSVILCFEKQKENKLNYLYLKKYM